MKLLRDIVVLTFAVLCIAHPASAFALSEGDISVESVSGADGLCEVFPFLPGC